VAAAAEHLLPAVAAVAVAAERLLPAVEHHLRWACLNRGRQYWF
jgi:hypothetical protein